MKLSLSLLATAGALAIALLGSAPVKADLVYDNGPINGNLDAFTINFGFIVTDSFVVSSPTTLTDAQIGLWLFPGDNATGLDWSIGTSPYGSDISSGTSTLSNAFQFTNGFGYNIFESAFALNGVVSPGTYYLTLQNLAVPSGDPGYWDENNGPSAAYDNGIGPLANFDVPGTTGSETFLINGRVADVPEPGSVAMLMGMGLSGAGFLLRKRNRK